MPERSCCEQGGFDGAEKVKPGAPSLSPTSQGPPPSQLLTRTMSEFIGDTDVHGPFGCPRGVYCPFHACYANCKAGSSRSDTGSSRWGRQGRRRPAARTPSSPVGSGHFDTEASPWSGGAGALCWRRLGSPARCAGHVWLRGLLRQEPGTTPVRQLPAGPAGTASCSLPFRAEHRDPGSRTPDGSRLPERGGALRHGGRMECKDVVSGTPKGGLMPTPHPPRLDVMSLAGLP